MTHYIKKGKRLHPRSKEALDLHDRLPVGTYTVGLDCDGNYFLEVMGSFEINHKLYGDTIRHSDRILRTFLDRKSACTGVLLTGCKGSGKTLLAKMISIQAVEQGIPTVVVNQEFCGEAFNTFMQQINQPVVVLFDEYEKVYKPCSQEKLLTLLDGVHPSQKLFLLTCNNKWLVNENMRNRPGRIYYMLDFDGLSPQFIREYCQDNLENQDHVEMVVTISGVFRAFNFDLLKGVVEEMNRYSETPSEVLKFLNARPAYDLKQIQYTVKLRDADGKVYSGRKDGIHEFNGNPLKDEVNLYYCKKIDDKGHKKQVRERFSATDLVGLNNNTGSYVFKNKRGVCAMLTPRKTEYEVDFDALPLTKSNGSSHTSTEKNKQADMAERAELNDVAWAMDVTEDESVGDY